MSHQVSATEAELDGFWKEFASRTWERQPLSLTSSPVQLELGDEELMRALTTAADPAARPKGSGLPRILVSVDGRTQPIDTRPFLPLPEDRTLDGYLARVDRRMRDHDWSVAVSGLHAVDAELWDRAKRLADDVYRYTGSPLAGRVDIDTFIGRYASTNVGVHVDHAGNFGFTLRGRKTLLTWPPERAEQVPQHTADYGAARELADVLVGVPGALTYFPPEQLHVGEAPDGVAVSVNIAFFTRSDPAALVVEAVGELLARAEGEEAGTGAPATDDSARAVTDRLPTAARVALARLSGLSSDAIADVVWEHHMCAVTSAGLGVGRPAGPLAAVPRRATVRKHADVQVRQRLLADGRRAVATQGHTLKVTDHPQVADAVATLGDGGVLALADWESAADPAAVPLLHAVLLRLASWRAIGIEAEPAP
ncbi:hypothetical protein G6045_02205 [Streptomyces sp. YC504]|uniref:Uncharacterized protein n=1 Tax=Streptomyces mesophilus TaxID=1775132 RepID=A0A6G4XCX7_9ACTN|nr:cupin domain-containing protein [Streptomyces mesophilus]NGO74501.1 hypothetical protein [Streptomyces mesophilus]